MNNKCMYSCMITFILLHVSLAEVLFCIYLLGNLRNILN